MTPTDIKQALEGGETGRELDAAIWKLLLPEVWIAAYNRQFASLNKSSTRKEAQAAERTAYVAPKFTTSVDAALALAGEVLPDHVIEIYIHPKASRAEISGQTGLHVGRFVSRDSSPAAAILLALINAKENANA